jgi:hypothetical protein
MSTPGPNRHDDVPLIAHTHEIAGLGLWQQRGSELRDMADQRRPFTHRNPSNRVARQVDVTDCLGGRRTKVQVRPALHDAEERLLIRPPVGLHASLKPADGPLVGLRQTLLMVVTLSMRPARCAASRFRLSLNVAGSTLGGQSSNAMMMSAPRLF